MEVTAKGERKLCKAERVEYAIEELVDAGMIESINELLSNCEQTTCINEDNGNYLRIFRDGSVIVEHDGQHPAFAHMEHAMEYVNDEDLQEEDEEENQPPESKAEDTIPPLATSTSDQVPSRLTEEDHWEDDDDEGRAAEGSRDPTDVLLDHMDDVDSLDLEDFDLRSNFDRVFSKPTEYKTNRKWLSDKDNWTYIWTDKRGYHLFGAKHPVYGPLFMAGCRYFTLKQALKHWGNRYRNQGIGEGFVAAINGFVDSKETGTPKS